MWPERRGLRVLVDDDTVVGPDRAFRAIYDWTGWGHDAFVAVSFPVLLGQREATARARFLAALALQPGLDVLEVGAGSGGNVPAIQATRPRRHVAVDLSTGMLARLVRRLEARAVETAVVDAHALPFEDDSFDRVIQVGAVNAMRDPALAMAEMHRVCRPGGKVVVVDEQLSGEVGRVRRGIFRLLTIYDKDPHAPKEKLPPGAADVRVDAVNDYFYAMSWTVTKEQPSRSSG